MEEIQEDAQLKRKLEKKGAKKLGLAIKKKLKKDKKLKIKGLKIGITKRLPRLLTGILLIKMIHLKYY